MTKTVVVTLATAEKEFAAGTVPGGIKVTLTGGTAVAASVVLTVAPFVATFNEVAPGDYTIVSQAIDKDGNALGDAVTVTQSIAPDAPATVFIEVPVSATVAVS